MSFHACLFRSILCVVLVVVVSIGHTSATVFDRISDSVRLPTAGAFWLMADSSNPDPSVLTGVSLTTLDTPYTENFDTLATTGQDFPIIDGETIPGWYATRPYYTASNGSIYAATNFSFGSSVSSTDRAFGSIAGNSSSLVYGIRLTNNTGTTITSLDVSYTGEQWRRSNNASAQTLVFDYRQAPVIVDLTGTYIPQPDLNFTTPIFGTGSYSVLNGNLAANRRLISGSISVNIPPGEEIMLRWTDAIDPNDDHAMAVDDLSITPRALVSPTISIDDVTQAEGNSGTTAFTFTTSLTSPAPAGGVSFNIATVDGTAQDGNPTGDDSDYIANNAVQTIPEGETSATFTVQVNGDASAEADETFFVNLTNINGATVGDIQGLGTITNDDPLPTIGFVQTSYSGMEGTTVALTINRFGDASGASMVDFTTSSGTANGGACGVADYVTQAGTVTFAPGESAKNIEIAVCSDTIPEPLPEQFGVSLSNPVGATHSGESSALVAIVDVARFENSQPLTISPGSTASSMIPVSGVSGAAVLVKVRLLGLSADIPDDLDLLLVGPNGASYVLMADVGGNSVLTSADLTVYDSAADSFPDLGPMLIGTEYRPTSCTSPVSQIPGAPPTPYTEPGCDSSGPTLAATYGYSDPTGDWTLYIRNDGGSDPVAGIGAVLAGGWAIEFMVPTAAEVSVGGRVMRSDGIGIGKAAVRIEGGDLSEPRTALTNSFGFYSFEGLTAGMTYVVTVGSKQYAFNTPSVLVTANDNVADANFTAVN